MGSLIVMINSSSSILSISRLMGVQHVWGRGWIAMKLVGEVVYVIVLQPARYSISTLP